MRVVTREGATIALGTTETGVTVGIIDHSRRVTDDFGVTTVVERGFSRRMSLRLAVPSTDVDALQLRLAALRATPAVWIADDRYASMTIDGIYREFEIDLAVPPMSFATLTVEGFGMPAPIADAGADPAPDGGASTLQLLSPAMPTLVSSSVAEDDAPAWDAGTPYAAKARVRRGRRVHEAVGAVPAGDDPDTASGKWLDVGPLNRWAMFDEALGSETTAAGEVTVVLDAGDVDAVALLDVTAAQVRVTAPGYDRTQAVGQGAGLFLDLPRGGGRVTVRITGPGTVRVGTLLIGRMVRLGVTGAAPSAGITDYSRKGVDEFGSPFLVKRAWSKRMALRALIRSEMVDLVVQRIAAVRARPTLWIGQSGTDALTVYGHWREFGIEVGQAVSTLSLAIDGMSGSAKLIPLGGGGPVDWKDLTDRTGAKPADNADRTADNVAKDTAAVGGRPAADVVARLDFAALSAANANVPIDEAVADGTVQAWQAQSVIRRLLEMEGVSRALARQAYPLLRDSSPLLAAYEALRALIWYDGAGLGVRDVAVDPAEWRRRRDRWTAERDALQAAIDNVAVGLGPVPASDFVATGVTLAGGAATGAGTIRSKKAYSSPQLAIRLKRGPVRVELIDAASGDRYGFLFRRDGRLDMVTGAAPLVPYDTAVRSAADVRVNLFDNGRTTELLRDVVRSDASNGGVSGIPSGRSWGVEITMTEADSAIEALTLHATRPIDYLTSVINGPPADATHGANVTLPSFLFVTGAASGPDAGGIYTFGTGPGSALIAGDFADGKPWGGEPYLHLAMAPIADTATGPATFRVVFRGPGSVVNPIDVDARRRGGTTIAVPFGTRSYEVRLATAFTAGEMRMPRPVLTPTAAAVSGQEVLVASTEDGIDGTRHPIGYNAATGERFPPNPVDDTGRVHLRAGDTVRLRVLPDFLPADRLGVEDPTEGARFIAVSHPGSGASSTGAGALTFRVTAGGAVLGAWEVGPGASAFDAILDVPAGVTTYKAEILSGVTSGRLVTTIPSIRLRRVRSTNNQAVLDYIAPVGPEQPGASLGDVGPNRYFDFRHPVDPTQTVHSVEEIKQANLIGVGASAGDETHVTVLTEILRNAAGALVRITQTVTLGAYRYIRAWEPGYPNHTALGWVDYMANRSAWGLKGWQRSDADADNTPRNQLTVPFIEPIIIRAASNGTIDAGQLPLSRQLQLYRGDRLATRDTDWSIVVPEGAEAVIDNVAGSTTRGLATIRSFTGAEAIFRVLAKTDTSTITREIVLTRQSAPPTAADFNTVTYNIGPYEAPNEGGVYRNGEDPRQYFPATYAASGFTLGQVAVNVGTGSNGRIEFSGTFRFTTLGGEGSTTADTLVAIKIVRQADNGDYIDLIPETVAQVGANGPAGRIGSVQINRAATGLTPNTTIRTLVIARQLPSGDASARLQARKVNEWMTLYARSLK